MNTVGHLQLESNQVPTQDLSPDRPMRLDVPSGRLQPALPGPSLFERALVLTALLAFYHQTPNVWFRLPGDFEQSTSNPVQVAVILGICGLLFIRVAGHLDLLITIVRIEPIIFLYVVVAIVSFLWSADPQTSLRRSTILAVVTLFGCYLFIRYALDEIITLVGFMFVVSAVLSLGMVVLFPRYGIDSDGLWTGVFRVKNGLGYVAALAIPTLLCARRTCQRHRTILTSAAILHLILLNMSGSKTMLVVGLLGAALVPIYGGLRGARTLRGSVLVLLLAGSAFSVALATANIGLLAGWLNKDVTLTGRLPFWEELLPVAVDRIWMGHGFSAAFGGYFSPVHEAWIYNQWAGDAHNAYLQIVLELGLVGLILFVASYVRAIRRATVLVALVPGAVGIWPLVLLSQAFISSVTESGLQSDEMGWTLYLVAALGAGGHLLYRPSLGIVSEPRHSTAVPSSGAETA